MAKIWQTFLQRGSVAGGETRANPNYGSMAAAVPTGGRAAWVDEESSLTSAAVLACVRLLSGTLAGLPLHVYERVGEGKERRDQTPLGVTLQAPNDWQTAYKWRETLWQWVLLYGNAVCRIRTDRRGELVALEPLQPMYLTYLEQQDGRGLVYQYRDPISMQTATFGAWEVLHLRGLAGDGRIGFGVIENLMRQAVGLALTLQSTASTFYENGSALSGVLMPGRTLTPATRDLLLESWQKMHAGPRNAGRVALLEFGDKYESISVPPEQAQFLESRQYSTLEIARAFGVPPHLIGVAEAQSYASAEQNNLEFVTYTLLPWVRNFEDEIWRSLILEEDRRKYFAEHDLKGLLRGDVKSRYEAYQIGVVNGWLSRNEVRSLESYNEVDGLDEYLAPLNMTTAEGLEKQAEQIGKEPAQPEPVPPAPTPTARNGFDAKAQRGEGREEKQLQVDIRALVPEVLFAWDDGHEHEERAEGDDWAEEEEDDTLTDAQKSARADRQGVAATFVDLWTDAATRLVKREVADLRRKLAALGDGPEALEAFRAWLEEFYRELQPKVPGYFSPVLNASLKAARKSVERELGRRVQIDFAEFASLYLSNIATGWVLSSQGQLGDLLDGEEPRAAVEQRIDEWEEKRGGKTGNQEAPESVNAGSVATYSAAGVVAIVWATRGKSCKFCKSMNGRRVATGRPFMEGDSTIVAADGETMRVYGAKRHGPLHQACDCVCVAA